MKVEDGTGAVPGQFILFVGVNRGSNMTVFLEFSDTALNSQTGV